MDDKPLSNDKGKGKGKGKGKATEAKQEATASGQSDQTDLVSRVVESTKELLRDTVGASHIDASNTLSSSSGLGGKAQPTRSSTTLTDGATLRSRPQGPTGTSLSSNTLSESFKSRVSSDTEQQFAQFASGDGLSIGNATPVIPESRDFEASWQSTTGDAEDVFDQKARPEEPAQYDDGAEVRALLSNPSFTAHMDDFDHSEIGATAQQTIDDLFPQHFSENEQQAIKQLKASLPPPPIHRPMPPDHPLNLQPRSDAEKLTTEKSIQSILSENALSSFDSKNQDDQWLSSWSLVLNSYTDEVWGDILPVVQEVKTQLEEVKAGQGSLDSKAAARLRMILGHLQQYEARH